MGNWGRPDEGQNGVPITTKEPTTPKEQRHIS